MRGRVSDQLGVRGCRRYAARGVVAALRDDGLGGIGAGQRVDHVAGVVVEQLAGARVRLATAGDAARY